MSGVAHQLSTWLDLKIMVATPKKAGPAFMKALEETPPLAQLTGCNGPVLVA